MMFSFPHIYMISKTKKKTSQAYLSECKETIMFQLYFTLTEHATDVQM